MTLDLTPTPDLVAVLDAAQSMLDTHYPVSRMHFDTGNDFCIDPLTPLAEFGTFMLAMPEEQGGAGLTVIEEARLHAAFGRHLLSPSVLATTIATRITLQAGQPDLSRQISDGDCLVASGVADRGANGTSLNTGDLLLIDPENVKFALFRDANDTKLIPLETAQISFATGLGHFRKMARASGVQTGSSHLFATPYIGLLHQLLCSAQLLGVAEGARDLAVEYALTREQFGRPIGSFQAIKHHCSNMAIEAEMLSAQLDFAAISLNEGAFDCEFQIAALARLAPRIALHNARLCIQIHGGIGFSAEADAHLYLKQAHLLRALVAGPDLLTKPAPLAPHGKAAR